MPQMMPLNWIILFIYFIILFMMMNSLNYFTKINVIKKISKNLTNNKINWKW